MPPTKSSFVTACQQLLALGVVLAALTPAASVVDLDVVRDDPGSPRSPRVDADFAVYTHEADRPSRVPTTTVDPKVREFALTEPEGRRDARLAIEGVRPEARAERGAAEEVTSDPEPVRGYGAVGVTWAHDAEVPEGEIDLKVRTRTDDRWSKWMDLDYDTEHGPDPGSPEARHARPGTDALLVGDVDQVQVHAEAVDGDLPAQMRLAVVDPGSAPNSAVEKPALDTSTMDGGTPTDPSTESTEPSTEPGSLVTDEGEGTGGSDRIELQAATYTPKPKIYSRAQWGADERMRDKSSLHYFEVHAGFVHHTVNANDYTRAEVPGIIRSIYAYHVRSRGWSDIGYNFLVDRFGRIWEGRYGGVDRPVVGAHTLNYNDYSFAMSAIGNYDIKRPSRAMIEAYGALFAWKLSLHGVDASSTRQRVGSRNFQAINGHRDAASTACPGRYLYAKIPRIRALAAAAQRGWSGRQLESDLAGARYPDLIVRRARDGRAFVIPTGGLTTFGRPARAATGLAGGDTVVASPDLTGDRIGDLVVRSADGTAWVRPGRSDGTFGDPVRRTTALAGHDLITAVGDLDGDGHDDLVARRPSGRLDAFLGRGNGRFDVTGLGRGWSGYDLIAGPGDITGDGDPDLLARDTRGALWLRPGARGTTYGAPVQVPGAWQRYSSISGYGDFNRDGRRDLFVRSARNGDGYIAPSTGNGRFGHFIGPVVRTRSVGSLVGAAQVSGDRMPDLVARTGGRVQLLANRGTVETRAPVATGVNLSGANRVLNAGDWDRDGHGDMISRSTASGALYVRRGDGTGHFGKPRRIATGFGRVRLLAAVGDMTGDGYPDLMGQPAGGAMRIYPGKGLAGLKASYVAHRAIKAGRQVPVGRWDGDGAPDSLFRRGSKLVLYPGNGPGGLMNPRSLRLDLSPYDWVVGVSDVGLKGHPDLIVRAKRTGDLWLIQGSASKFAPRRFLAEGMGRYDLVG
jgi:hypothetical protein